ncbi:hypothetical protein DH2020_014066 [Rehmannia glutinosa]|uniref:Transmembrane protein n=1 Tax=Rehmannia glutinosa TaxID=99300 RepID=A0ABR0WVV7_REHGL
MGFSATATSAAVLYFLAFISVFSRSSHVTALAGSDVVVNATPVVLVESVPSKDVVRCARVTVSGLSRLKLGSYSSAHRITLVPSDEIQDKSYKNVQICLHRSVKTTALAFLRLRLPYLWILLTPLKISFAAILHLGCANVIMITGKASRPEFGALVKLEFHKWRLLCLAIGFVLLLLAPIVSSWVPFYYSSSMAIGVCLVVIILLFQNTVTSVGKLGVMLGLAPFPNNENQETMEGMKLLPTGRKNALYSTLCGLALGAGSFLLNRFSMFVNSILVNFGISEEMHNPVLVFLLVGIVLAGAGFGYWLVRKSLLRRWKCGRWCSAICEMGFTCNCCDSTLDTPLAMALLVFLLGIYFSLTSSMLHGLGDITYSGGGYSPRWRSSVRVNKNKRTEFLSRSGTTTPRRSLWKSPKSSPAWSNSPAKVYVQTKPQVRTICNQVELRCELIIPLNLFQSQDSDSSYDAVKSFIIELSKGAYLNPQDYNSTPSSLSGSTNRQDYYSTFHRTPNRKKFSKEEWKDFTEESTRQALAEWASSPEFTDWIVKHADRIQLQPEISSDESIGSGSDSTDENIAQSSSGRGLLWQRRH